MKLHHRLDGPADGPLLVLGPSLGTTLDVWQPQLPELTAGWRVLRYDLPGDGDSPPAEGFTIDDLARAVLDLVDEPYFHQVIPPEPNRWGVWGSRLHPDQGCCFEGEDVARVA